MLKPGLTDAFPSSQALLTALSQRNLKRCPPGWLHEVREEQDLRQCSCTGSWTARKMTAADSKLG